MIRERLRALPVFLESGGKMSQERRAVVVVGLTGGIGAGKSTALALFAEEGASTISADAVVHDLYSRVGCKRRLVAHFGAKVLDGSGEVDRRRLADLVRGRREELRWLEKLAHPLVAKDIERRIRKAPAGSVVVCEVPLLFESRYEGLFDLIVTIEAGPQIRRSRSIHRFGPEMFSEFERLQASTDRRVVGSNLAFFNDGDLDALRDFVRGAYALAQSLLEERR